MITLPERLPNEGDRAYAAFMTYCSMGVQRSIRPLAQSLGKSSKILDRWSQVYKWQERVKVYDDQLHSLVALEHARAHLTDVEKLRNETSRLADKLIKAAEAILDRIITESSEIYINAQSLTVVSNTVTKALDLHSHGLGIDALLPQLKAELDEAADD